MTISLTDRLANRFADDRLAAGRLRVIETLPRMTARAIPAALEQDRFSATESALLLGAFFSLLASAVAFTLL